VYFVYGPLHTVTRKLSVSLCVFVHRFSQVYVAIYKVFLYIVRCTSVFC
jgi:hypothetical protein